MRITTLLASTSAALLLTAALAGCSSPASSGSGASTSPKPTMSSTEAAMMSVTGTFAGENGKNVAGTVTISGDTVTLSDFSSDEGPDLHLYLATGTTEADVTAGTEIGAVKWDAASQTFTLPAGVHAGDFTDLVVHCDKALAVFGAAPPVVVTRAEVVGAAREAGTFRAAGVALATLARVGLGVLWIGEALVKWQAGFGGSDILLVVSSTGQNPRVPDFYSFFTQNVLGAVPDLFGFIVPLIEFGLGVLLVLGVFTLPVALASAAQLIAYWFADQLITQYPIMIGLSIVVATFSCSASRLSLTAFVLRRVRSVPSEAVRRWL